MTTTTVTLIDTTSTDRRTVAADETLRVIMRSGSTPIPQGIALDEVDGSEAREMTAAALAAQVASLSEMDDERRASAPRSYSGHGRAWYVLDEGTETYWRTTVAV